MEAPGGEGKAEVLWPQLTVTRAGAMLGDRFVGRPSNGLLAMTVRAETGAVQKRIAAAGGASSRARPLWAADYFVGGFGATTACFWVPMPSRAHTAVSPARIQRGSARSMFVPAGDPPEMRSPGPMVRLLVAKVTSS